VNEGTRISSTRARRPAIFTGTQAKSTPIPLPVVVEFGAPRTAALSDREPAMPSPIPAADFPVRLANPTGLSVQLNANGSIRRIDHQDIMLNLFLGTEVEGGPANLWLRRHGAEIEAVPLLGPQSPAPAWVESGGLVASGSRWGLRFTVSLVLAESANAWVWRVELENVGDRAETVDLIYAQDLGLAHYGAIRLNEYYVSQYLDHAPLRHPQRGWVVASRQNLAMGGRHPWCVIGSLGEGVAYATDALQVHGRATRAGEVPEGLRAGLPGRRLQHEHAMAAVQDAPVTLEPGDSAVRGFFGWFEEHHPAASSDADLSLVDRVLALPEAAAVPGGVVAVFGEPAASLFSAAPLLDALELSAAELDERFGTGRRAIEYGEDGRLWSFFTGKNRHVVLKAKECRVLRPHGHILRTGHGWTPDEAGLTSTVWMAGVFHSMLTQGHVSINRVLSTTRSYLGLLRSPGQRVFVEAGEGWRLLDLPSAFEMAPESCRWVYRHAGGLIEVRAQALRERHELTLEIEVLAGEPVRCLVSHHVAANGDDGAEAVPVRFERDGAGVFVRPIPESDLGRRFPEGGFRIDPQPGTLIEALGGDELLFLDGRSRRQPFLCLVTAPARSVGLRFRGSLVPETVAVDEPEPEPTALTLLKLRPPAASPLAPEAARLAEILPWFTHDALIHYLNPRGLEQYSGGGWGTRDVTQGPAELLRALGRFAPLRDLLIRVFKNQNADGDWPQWFMFFDRERNIRPGESHGDIVFWPLLVLAEYLKATGDGALLDEAVPFFHPEGEARAEHAPVREHLARALAVIEARRIPGTRLAAYGHGDWNDSLQPADPEMRERLCSAWTVTLHYQTVATLAEAHRTLGDAPAAESLDRQAEAVRADFRRLLIVDGTLAGFAWFHPERTDYLLHPADHETGLHYSLLPMIHALINGLLDPDQAARHLDLIREHLLGADGARLFDRPLEYRGGPQTLFQRAESSSFFGREIGLMYTHAHLRYAEALARHGDAEGFFRALGQAHPVGLRDLVPAAAPRQANCYYSSSDAAFADRYEAYAEYDRALSGDIPLEGGWRVYSSGAGVAVRLVVQCLLGLKVERARLVVDPVIPPALDGLRAELELAGHPLDVVYRVGTQGSGPLAVELNGTPLPFERAPHPYRTGAALVPLDAVRARLQPGGNRLVIRVG
jgi:cellobiose phosphorylase